MFLEWYPCHVNGSTSDWLRQGKPVIPKGKYKRPRARARSRTLYDLARERARGVNLEVKEILGTWKIKTRLRIRPGTGLC